MASNSLGYITVWEYESQCQRNLWVPHKPSVCQMIEKAFRSSHKRMTLTRFEIDFKASTQRDIYSDDRSRIRQQQYPSTCATAKGVLWAWSDDYNWEPYSVSTTTYIETEYRKRKEIIDLSDSPLRIPNFIDTKRMVQVNKITNQARQVRRETMNDHYPSYVEKGTTQSTTSYGQTSPVHGQTSPVHGQNKTRHDETGNLLFSSTVTNDLQNIHLSQQTSRIFSTSPTQQTVTRPLTGPLAEFAAGASARQQTDDECAICLESLSSAPVYDQADVQEAATTHNPNVLKLLKCKHMFHHACLKRMYDVAAKDGCLQCPTCKTIHGVKKGNQPSNGTINVTTNSTNIPGYPGSGSIVILYNFSGGTQGKNHPSPGKPYYAYGFPRTCYLPNNAKGKKVLRLLRKAFERKLVFTIGISRTTGAANTVTWNDIHHKTEGYSNTSGYGYPDPNYLDNLLAELASHGVTEEDI